jgi:hypothetical protein
MNVRNKLRCLSPGVVFAALALKWAQCATLFVPGKPF